MTYLLFVLVLNHWKNFVYKIICAFHAWMERCALPRYLNTNSVMNKKPTCNMFFATFQFVLWGSQSSKALISNIQKFWPTSHTIFFAYTCQMSQIFERFSGEDDWRGGKVFEFQSGSGNGYVFVMQFWRMIDSVHLQSLRSMSKMNSRQLKRR